MNSEFVANTIQLNSAVFQRQAYSIVQNKITFRNNRWINIPYMPKWDPGTKYTAYDVSSAFNTIYPVSDRTPAEIAADLNPQDTYFSMQFRQSSKTIATGSTREAVSNTFQRFGSYLALILRFAGYLLGAYQKFSLDNSMTKKLYNHIKDEQEDEMRADKEPPADISTFQQDLKSEVKERRLPFKYNMWNFFCKKNFSSPWCCCCRYKSVTADALQARAKKRLYQELDIAEILQKLRVARFVSELALTKEQRFLVNYHSEYMLYEKSANQVSESEFSASRYLDHEREDGQA
jgi:hypothetical protein